MLNIHRSLLGNAAEVSRTIKTKNLDLLGLLETNLTRQQDFPMNGVIGDSRGESEDRERNNRPGAIPMGPKARDGVMVITENARIASSLIDTSPDGKWVVLKMGPFILITAYLAPRNTEAELLAFNTMRDDILRRFDETPIICMGDWNARMGALTGDHGTVSEAVRRRWMTQWLNNPEWTRIEPTEGKWTTITREGRGITDLVFVNRYAQALVANLVVHEAECIAGSDHRLLTFEVHLQSGHFKPEFQRLNIRKLLRMSKEHGKKLREGRVKVLTDLTALMEGINEAADANELWSWECQRAMVDAAVTIINN